MKLIHIMSYLEGRSDLVGKGFAPYTHAAFARARWVTCLDHKPFDVSVPEAVIVIVGCTQGEEVLRETMILTRVYDAGAKGCDVRTSAVLGTASQNISIWRGSQMDKTRE